jgi:hypothetical protein
MLTKEFRCSQEILPSDHVDQGDEGYWDTVGEPAGASRSPAPTVEELVAQLTCQPPVAEEPTATEAEAEAPAEAGLSTSPASLAPQP